MSGVGPTPEQLALLPHDSLGPALAGTTWMLAAIATIFLALRIYCKLSRGLRLWWDDWILLAAWITLVVQVSLTSYLVSFGYGKHAWDFSVDNIPKILLPLTVRSTFTLTLLAWSKTAFGVTLLRLTEGWLKRAVWFIIITVNIALGLSAMLPWLQCKPLYAAWTLGVESKCWPTYVVFHFHIFSGGEHQPLRSVIRSSIDANHADSLLGRHGFRSCLFAVEASLGSYDGKEGQGGGGCRHEHGCVGRHHGHRQDDLPATAL
jgi:hypothetical protein